MFNSIKEKIILKHFSNQEWEDLYTKFDNLDCYSYIDNGKCYDSLSNKEISIKFYFNYGKIVDYKIEWNYFKFSIQKVFLKLFISMMIKHWNDEKPLLTSKDGRYYIDYDAILKKVEKIEDFINLKE